MGGQSAPIMQGLFLSTPSARRATSFLVSAAVCFGISIHALREEGDDHPGLFSRGVDISIHALREEGDCPRIFWHYPAIYFYPRPPRGGRPGGVLIVHIGLEFLSTPSARRATPTSTAPAPGTSNFYPRPPRGGRRYKLILSGTPVQFLSTPSARRATRFRVSPGAGSHISIHALREEGDRLRGGGKRAPVQFLSTPSARRATQLTILYHTSA